jgi:hypothetical protein
MSSTMKVPDLLDRFGAAMTVAVVVIVGAGLPLSGVAFAVLADRRRHRADRVGYGHLAR